MNQLKNEMAKLEAQAREATAARQHEANTRLHMAEIYEETARVLEASTVALVTVTQTLAWKPSSADTDASATEDPLPARPSSTTMGENDFCTALAWARQMERLHGKHLARLRTKLQTTAEDRRDSSTGKGIQGEGSLRPAEGGGEGGGAYDGYEDYKTVGALTDANKVPMGLRANWLLLGARGDEKNIGRKERDKALQAARERQHQAQLVKEMEEALAREREAVKEREAERKRLLADAAKVWVEGLRSRGWDFACRLAGRLTHARGQDRRLSSEKVFACLSIDG